MAIYTPLKKEEATVGTRIRLMRIPKSASNAYLWAIGMVGRIDEIETDPEFANEMPISIKLDNSQIGFWCDPGDLARAEETDTDWPYRG